jgi:uncharacterized lipoprotein YddW (UPF0748 family)
MFNRLLFVFASVFVLSPAVAAQATQPVPKTEYELVDGFLGLQAGVQKVWEPMAGTGPVSVMQVGGRKALRMPCNFHGTKFDRASWDRKVKLDLAVCNGVQFLFCCCDPSPVASFSIYFHSGNGWYRCGFDVPNSVGWRSIKIYKNAAEIEGQPAGWGKVDTIRISAWRGQDVDTEFYITAFGLLGADAKIVIIRGDSAANEMPDEKKAVAEYADIMAQFLDRAGLSYGILSDLDVTARRLKDRKLIILPHNPKMPDETANEIADFLRHGGKLIACYNLPNRLEQVVGILSGPHPEVLRGQEYEGYFASIRPSEQPLQGMPAITKQNSWNIREASAVDGRSRVAAWWYDDKGQPTGEPAIVASDNCICLTHVLLGDDRANKLRLLLAMIGNLVPQLWDEAARDFLDRVGRFGPYDGYDAAEQGVKKLASQGPALQALDEAGTSRSRGLIMLSEGKFSDAILAAENAQKSMIEAYYLAQTPLAGEHRAFWCHSAFGVDGMTWDQAIERLAANGFTAILPNMLWGGVAFYESDVLPVAPAVKERGDQIALCLAACKKHGIKCYIWKVNYNMGWQTDKQFMASMKAQGRTQVNYDGSANDRWLCPSHPENQTLEIESMLEVARKYDVDGLHFDYIRYPGNEGCFCPGCRLRFENAIGRKVSNWPSDLRQDEDLSEKWMDFRRQQITSVVAAVAERAKAIRPGIKISAAVFRNWPVDRNAVGQDWKLWCDRGYLDFVCPMDYTYNSSHFERMVVQQLGWAGKVPCYPGIGLSVWSDPTDICKLIEQINITRRLGTDGFTIFNYAVTEANDVLPLLGKGITRPTAKAPSP